MQACLEKAKLLNVIMHVFGNNDQCKHLSPQSSSDVNFVFKHVSIKTILVIQRNTFFSNMIVGYATSNKHT